MKDPREEQAEEAVKRGEEIQAKLYNVSKEETVPVEASKSQEIKPDEKKPEKQAEKSGKKSKEGIEPTQESKSGSKKPEEETWKSKFDTLQGKYNAEIAKLKARVEEAEKRASEWRDTVAEIGKYKATEAKQREKPEKVPEIKAPKIDSVVAQPQKHVTDEDLEDYGPEQYNYVKRVAQEVVDNALFNFNKAIGDVIEKRFNQIEGRIAPVADDLKTVKATQVKSREDKFWEDIDRLCPDLQQYNYDPAFNDWLDQPSVEAGFKRRELLNDAFYNLDANRVARLFNAFLNSSQVNKQVTTQPESVAVSEPVTEQSVAVPSEPETPVAGKQVPTVDIEDLISPGVSKAGQSAIAVAESDTPPFSIKTWEKAKSDWNNKRISLEDYEKIHAEFDAALREGRVVP